MTDPEFIEAFQKAEELKDAYSIKAAVAQHMCEAHQQATLDRDKAEESYRRAVFLAVHGREAGASLERERVTGNRTCLVLHDGIAMKFTASFRDDHPRFAETSKKRVALTNITTQ